MTWVAGNSQVKFGGSYDRSVPGQSEYTGADVPKITIARTETAVTAAAMRLPRRTYAAWERRGLLHRREFEVGWSRIYDNDDGRANS